MPAGSLIVTRSTGCWEISASVAALAAAVAHAPVVNPVRIPRRRTGPNDSSSPTSSTPSTGSALLTSAFTREHLQIRIGPRAYDLVPLHGTISIRSIAAERRQA